MLRQRQEMLFSDLDAARPVSAKSSSTFSNNMKLPVHRWFRYSAGFSAEWVEDLIRNLSTTAQSRVFDPFAGCGTTLLAAEQVGVESWGIESHPFIFRVAQAKLKYRTCPDTYLAKAQEMRCTAKTLTPRPTNYPPLIYKCYDEATLSDLDVLRQAYELIKDDSAASDLAWLTLIGILRKTSNVGTAQWQYVLPRKEKRSAQNAFAAFDESSRMMYLDMLRSQRLAGSRSNLLQSDARTCAGVPDGWAKLVITSPPYPNNYDYADATRLEMSFMQEIAGWGDLQYNVRRHLIRSCTQHVPEKTVDLEATLSDDVLAPIHRELAGVCGQLAEVRKSKGGKKTYHLMVASYFRDLALVWHALRRVAPKAHTFVLSLETPPPMAYMSRWSRGSENWRSP